MNLWIDFFIVAYFLALNSSYAVFLLISALETRRAHAKRLPELDYLTLSEKSTPPITIIAPAFNEAAGIINSIRGLLHLEYPYYEVFVVNDGSTDNTLDLLKKRFDLEIVDLVIRSDLETKPIRSIYHSRTEERLWVIDKENGGKADALNVGLNACRTPLVCCVDADSLVDRRALLRLVEPFCYGSEEAVAVGGTIRLANGLTIHDGVIRKTVLPRSWLARFQIIEYLRAFLFARTGLNRLGGNLIISGALGLFTREVIIAVGGYAKTVGEDMELVVRIHRYMRTTRQPYRVIFIPDPICYTEAPESITILGRQRDRWQRGLVDSLWRHRGMLLNPVFGKVGMLTFPFFVLFEMLGPIVEGFGYIWFAVSVASGNFQPTTVLLFFFTAFLLGMLVSLQALILDDVNQSLYRGATNRFKLILAAAFENFGYRQVVLLFRIRGMIKFLVGAKSWGKMKRKGL